MFSRIQTRFPGFATLLAAAAMMTATEVYAQDNPWGGPAGNGKYADVNGIKLYYEIHGTGRPLVLLHGGLGAIPMFGANLPELAKGRQVIAVDLQGHGRTADIDRPITIEFMADDIAALIKHLKLGRTDILGYSMGGGVAMQTAIRHPELINKLVVVSTPFRRSGFYPEILAMQKQVNAGAAEFMKETPMYQLYKSIAPRPQDFPRLLDKMGAMMEKGFTINDDDIRKIQARTLIVAGDADIFPPSHAVEMFALLGGGLRDAGWDGAGMSRHRLAILPGLTHYNIFMGPAVPAVAIPFLDEDPR